MPVDLLREADVGEKTATEAQNHAKYKRVRCHLVSCRVISLWPKGPASAFLHWTYKNEREGG